MWLTVELEGARVHQPRVDVIPEDVTRAQRAIVYRRLVTTQARGINCKQ